MSVTPDSFAVDRNIPGDQAMLLKLIDAKFETQGAKLDGIHATLTAMNERFGHYDDRFDNHERRLAEIEGSMKARELQVKDYEDTKVTVKNACASIVALEKWQTEEQTTTRNASRWGGVIWGAIGSGVTAGAMFLMSLYFQGQPARPVHPVTKPVAEVTHTQSSGTSTTQVVPSN